MTSVHTKGVQGLINKIGFDPHFVFPFLLLFSSVIFSLSPFSTHSFRTGLNGIDLTAIQR